MKSIPDTTHTAEAGAREKKNRETAYRAALGSIVLLKNDGLLPMEPCKIALFGAGASHTVKGGTLAADVRCRKSVSLLKGMTKVGFSVTSSRWLVDYERDYDRAKTAWDEEIVKHPVREKAHASFPLPTGREVTFEDIAESQTDTAIYVITRESTETYDEAAVHAAALRPEELASIARMTLSYKKVILVLNMGFQPDLTPLDKYGFSAIILLGLPGMEGGRAFADILTGKESPSGKLADTWLKQPGDAPLGFEGNASLEDEQNDYYKEGIFTGYRYTNAFGVKVRYPFGFGLTYTTFGLRATNVTLDGTTVKMGIGVVNTGEKPGKEAVQVYVSCPRTRLPKERQRLVGFAKTHTLAPTEPQILSLSFDLYDCASYSEEECAYILESGVYTVRLGDCSDATVPVATLTLRNKITLTENKPLCPLDTPFFDLTPPAKRVREPIVKIPNLTVSSEPVPTKPCSYRVPEPILSEKAKEILAKVSSVGKMAQICVGEGIGGLFSGKKRVTPGAVARTTSSFCRDGLVNLTMADGPAGLSLARASALSATGKPKFYSGEYPFAALNYLSQNKLRLLEAKEGRGSPLYQFTTAFPLGSSLAQTWDPKLCEEVGRAISEEMTEYGVSFWLGPAMTLHRKPFAQTNAGTFSEDPVLSGKIGAALVRGVQSVPGNFAAVRPFACARPEESRRPFCAHVSERALRELYLKGIEICIRESSPRAVMTGLSRVNGVAVASSKELCTDLLRGEWGFDGLLMTDRLAVGKGSVRSDHALAAGHDLILPGGKKSALSLLLGLGWKTVSKSDLERASARVIAAVTDSLASEKAGEETKEKRGKQK